MNQVTYTNMMKDCLAGIRTSIRHLLWLFNQFTSKISVHVSPPDENETVSHKSKNDEMNRSRLKVVGVGFGRTGTYSLKLALDQLGYHTLHTQHIYETPEILDMWVERVFQPAIDAETLQLGKPDFDLITDHGFDAIVDLPTALYFKELNEKFPNCKFILTTRKDSEVWFRSFEIMVKSIDQVTNMGGNFMRHVHQLAIYSRWLNAVVTKNTAVLKVPVGRTLPHPNKESSIASYEEHNTAVRNTIPAERLLEYSVNEGWLPLCEFLDVTECPTKQFPKENSMLSLKVQSSFCIVILMSFTLLAMIILFRSMKRMRKIRYSRRILAKKIF